MGTDSQKLARIRKIVDDEAGWQLAASQLQQKIIDILDEKIEWDDGLSEEALFTLANSSLGRAVQEYVSVKSPDHLVLDWVVISQRSSIDLERQGIKAVGHATAAGQSFVTTRGLLEIALDEERKKRVEIE